MSNHSSTASYNSEDDDDSIHQISVVNEEDVDSNDHNSGVSPNKLFAIGDKRKRLEVGIKSDKLFKSVDRPDTIERLLDTQKDIKSDKLFKSVDRRDTIDRMLDIQKVALDDAKFHINNMKTLYETQQTKIEHLQGSLEVSQRVVMDREEKIRLLEGQVRALRDCLDCVYAERDLLKSDEQKFHKPIGSSKEQAGDALEKLGRVKAQEANKAVQDYNLDLSEKLKANGARAQEVEIAEAHRTSSNASSLDEEAVQRVIRKYRASDEFQKNIRQELVDAHQQGMNKILRVAASDGIEEEVLEDWLRSNFVDASLKHLHDLIPFNRDEYLEIRQLDRDEGKVPWVAPEIDPTKTLEYRAFSECTYIHLSEAQIKELEEDQVTNVIKTIPLVKEAK